MKTTGTPAVEWPPGGASSAKSAASPRRASTDFGALLDNHQARTAVAEGPKKEAKLDKKLEQAERKLEREHPEHPPMPAQAQGEPKKAACGTAQPAAEQPVAVEGDQPTVETPVLVVDPLVELTQPVLTEAQPQAAAPVAEQPALEAPVQPQPVAAEPAPVAAPEPVEAAVPVQQPVETGAPAPVTEQQQATQQPVTEKPQQPQTQTPAATAPPVSDEAPAEAPVADSPEAPAARPDKPAHPQQAAHHEPGTDPQPERGNDHRSAEQRPAGQQRVEAPQPRSEAAAKPEPKPAPAPGPAPAAAPAAQAQVTAPAGTPAPQAVANAAPQALTRSVPLSRAAEAVENVIRLGSARGVAHARMSLRPADLGGVEIRLQQTAGGLVASVVADGIEAAQALLQAGHDLQRRLEAQGIELQRLDISYSGDDRSGARSSETRTGDPEQRSAAGNETDSHATDGGDLTPTDDTTATSVLELPGGVLVDVLA